MPITGCWDILSVKPCTYSSLMLGTPWNAKETTTTTTQTAAAGFYVFWPTGICRPWEFPKLLLFGQFVFHIVSNDLDKNLVHLRHQASRAKRLGKDKWDSGYHCLLLCFDSLYPVHSKVIYNITVKMLYMCDMLRQLIDPCILEPWLCIYIQSNNLLNHTLRTASKVAGLY